MRLGPMVLLLLAMNTPFAPAAAQSLSDYRVGSIDWFGVRTLSADSLLRRVGVQVGDTAAVKAKEIERRLLGVPGVAQASAAYVCCTPSGGLMLYLGVAERGDKTTIMKYSPPPSGAVRLPPAVARAGAAFDSAFALALQRGDMAEDESQGHALMHDPAARAIQLSFADLAAGYDRELRDVLAHSSDAAQRAVAAQVLAYAADKRTVIPALVAAARDPDDDVRNNAVRALAVIAQYGGGHPEKGIHVPGAAFVSLLNSMVWSDVNKASFALAAVTGGAHPDTAALALVRERALGRLVDMARWSDRAHAGWPFLVLGRAIGLSEAVVDSAWAHDDREVVIRPAEQRARRGDPPRHH